MKCGFSLRFRRNGELPGDADAASAHPEQLGRFSSLPALLTPRGPVNAHRHTSPSRPSREAWEHHLSYLR